VKKEQSICVYDFEEYKKEKGVVFEMTIWELNRYSLVTLAWGAGLVFCEYCWMPVDESMTALFKKLKF
jgi:hypothetical protein